LNLIKIGESQNSNPKLKEGSSNFENNNEVEDGNENIDSRGEGNIEHTYEEGEVEYEQIEDDGDLQEGREEGEEQQ